MGSTLFHRYKQEEYTGVNRCTPCTVLNVAIAVLGSGLVSFVLFPAIGVVAVTLSLVLIYYRGYLVPGTPKLTKRYLPDWILARFDKLGDGIQGEGSTGDHVPEEILLDANSVRPCDDVDDLCLTDSFREDWQARIDTIEEGATETAQLSEILDVNAEELSIEEYDSALVARFGEQRVGQWESHAALLADLAGAKVLKSHHSKWGDFSAGVRGRVLSSLRIFLKSCPSCGGDVAMKSDTVESCCRTMDTAVVNCAECSSRLLEVERST